MTKNLKLSIGLFITLFLIFLIGWFYFPTVSLPLGAILIVVFVIIEAFLWNKNLEAGIIILFLSLFFERLPTLEVSGFSLKLSLIAGLGLIIAWFINYIRNRCHPEFISGSQTLKTEIPDLVRNDKKSLSLHITHYSLLAFWIINLISLIINPITFRGFSIFILISFNIILFFVISLSDFKRDLWLKISKILIIGAVIVSIFALWQFVGDLAGVYYKWTFLREHYTKIVFGFPRIQGTFLEPMLFANFLLIPIFIGFSLWLKKQISSKFFIPTEFLMLTVMILTLSRSSYLALIIAGMAVLILAFKDIIQWKILAISLLVFLSAIGVALGLVRIGGGKNAFSNFVLHSAEVVLAPSKQSTSTAERLGTYGGALGAFKEKPILGIGPGGYGRYYYDKNNGNDPNQGTQTVNNEYLEILAENGILGTLAIVIFWLSLLIYGIRKYIKESDAFFKTMILGLIAGSIAIFVQYNFFSSLYVIYIWVLWALLGQINVSNLESYKQ